MKENKIQTDNRIFVNYRLNSIQLDTFDDSIKEANVNFLKERNETTNNGPADIPYSFSFKCDVKALADKPINTIWKIELLKTEFAIVFADKNLIKDFGIISGEGFDFAKAVKKK